MGIIVIIVIMGITIIGKVMARLSAERARWADDMEVRRCSNTARCVDFKCPHRFHKMSKHCLTVRLDGWRRQTERAWYP